MISISVSKGCSVDLTVFIISSIEKKTVRVLHSESLDLRHCTSFDRKYRTLKKLGELHNKFPTDLIYIYD